MLYCFHLARLLLKRIYGVDSRKKTQLGSGQSEAARLVGDREPLYVHSHRGQSAVHRTQGGAGQVPGSRQDPGEVHVEKAEEVGAGVDQGVGGVVCRQHHVRRVHQA